ncbi:MAG: 7-cyano-7-deazaguanine synthase QueC [Candidatus Delongbacteria bacterium]|nr:7-cyano-7-deazaguanine synthase QueC [Candidatus Delongbacteria bacterium]MCG2761129.1 7-cyano-7-deazaguanine synthase QueC [Candidatus Delongbacteria bacterium]
MNRAIVLLSGGLDSTTCLAIAKSKGYEIYALSFDYGQKHFIELRLAKYNAKFFKTVEHKIVKLDRNFFKNSALTNREISVKKDNYSETDIPNTYVPARNTVFLSYALAYAETVNSGHIFIGVNIIDYSGYPDCRQEFIKSFEKLANLALKETVEGKMRIKIETPLLFKTKSEIIKIGKKLGIDYSKTISCYDPTDGKACGHCDSCLLRKKGFGESGFADETIYV